MPPVIERTDRVLRLREDDLSWREAIDATVVLDHRSWVYLSINGSGASLWSALVRGATHAQLVERLVGEYGIDHERANNDVQGFLTLLAERELLAS